MNVACGENIAAMNLAFDEAKFQLLGMSPAPMLEVETSEEDVNE